jgi:membrane fusion protein, multidrug efflux system
MGLASAAVSCLGVLLLASCSKPSLPPAGPPDVDVIAVAQKDVPITRDWVATLNGLVNAQVRAQVSGVLLKQQYPNGSIVKTGQPLFQIDPRPFQASLDQATANLSQAKANLQRALAQSGKTQQDVDRYTPLAKESAISQQELDDAIQNNLAAKAQVEQSRAAIESAQAAAENARLNLTFASITSPIEGVSAIATAQVGDLVGPQSGPLTTVSSLNPILVIFNPSEQEYLGAMREAAKMGYSDNENLNRFAWHLQLADGSEYGETGHFYALNRNVDIRTGAIEVQVQFANPGNLLRPGGFGRVSTVVRIVQGAMVVPQRAVSQLQGGYQVAVVGPDNKVSIRAVTVGEKSGQMWIVTDGLKPGEKVVAEGTQQAKEGTVVNPKPYKEPPAATPAKTGAAS